MMEPIRHLTPRQKAAVLVMAIGGKASADILTHLSSREKDLLNRELDALGAVPPQVIHGVIAEFARGMGTSGQGGANIAPELLKSLAGAEPGTRYGHSPDSYDDGDGVLNRIDGEQLKEIVASEHPQTIALVMTQLDPVKAALLLKDLPEDLQKEIVYRVSTMEPVLPAMIREVKEAIKSSVTEVVQGSGVGGTRSTADILNVLGKEVGKIILEDISQRDNDLAAEIEVLMFSFDDLQTLEDKAIQRILREIEREDLMLALKGASEEMKTKITSNMSQGAREQLEEDMSYMGPVRRKDVEEVQKKIVDIVKTLEESNEIIIPDRSGTGDEIIA